MLQDMMREDKDSTLDLVSPIIALTVTLKRQQPGRPGDILAHCGHRVTFTPATSGKASHMPKRTGAARFLI